MNAPAAGVCCRARGTRLARVCDRTRPRGSRRAVPATHAQSLPCPSITGGQVSALIVPWRGPLSRVFPCLTAPGGVLCSAAVPLDGHTCRRPGGRGTAEGLYGSERGRGAGMLLGAEKGGPQGTEGVVVGGWVASLPLTKLVGPPGTGSSQEEAPPPERGRNPLDLPTPVDLSVVLCRLRDELPSFFDGHHSYSLYSEDLVFQCNLLPLQLQLNSVQGYRLLVGFSRRLCLALLCRPRLELLKITKDVDEGCVRARWRLVGSLRLLHFAERALVDAVSTFDVNSIGLISRHQIDQVVPSKETQMVANWLPQS